VCVCVCVVQAAENRSQTLGHTPLWWVNPQPPYTSYLHSSSQSHFNTS
jgi:hypothetical protein